MLLKLSIPTKHFTDGGGNDFNVKRPQTEILFSGRGERDTAT